VEKVDLCKGYWHPQRITEVAKHLFEIISLESQQKYRSNQLLLKTETNDVTNRLASFML